MVDVAAKLGVLGLDPLEFRLERPEARQAQGLEDEDRHGDQRERKHRDGQSALNHVRGRGHVNP